MTSLIFFFCTISHTVIAYISSVYTFLQIQKRNDENLKKHY